MKRNIGSFICVCILILCMLVSEQTKVTAYADTYPDYESINRQFAEEVEKYHIPGMAVIFVDKDSVIFSETYGICESTDTPFIIGSMSKSFTALAIMQLAEDGKINLDSTISDYIDTSKYFSNPSDGSRITVRQLLNQTSGLGTYQRLGNAEITNSYGSHKYANVNYCFLGKIIEATSGESYADYMEEHIFASLQMNHTAATLEKSRENGLIDGYRNYFGIPIVGEPDYPTEKSWSGVPAGYISSSISDMGKYLQMYLNGGKGIISQENLDRMFYESVPADDVSHYGMGWFVSNDNKEFSHSGLVENYMSFMILFPERELGAAVFINTNDYLVTDMLTDNILKTVRGEQPDEISGKTYVLEHLILDFIYLIILVVAFYPLITIKSWNRRAKNKNLLIMDIIRHGIFPILLIILPYLVGVPIWVVWYFVKDLCIILVMSSILLFGTGIYKLIFALHKKTLV